jgi:hypothetical protein
LNPTTAQLRFIICYDYTSPAANLNSVHAGECDLHPWALASLSILQHKLCLWVHAHMPPRALAKLLANIHLGHLRGHGKLAAGNQQP